MHLLKTDPSTPNALELTTIQNHTQISYTILSHTWSPNPEDEVLYPDIIAGTAHLKSGMKKIQAAMRQSRLDGYDFCWVDTCCIDKSSSAELSEAINSMWRWYLGARKCYAYLADVEVCDGSAGEGSEGFVGLAERLAQSRWFTRGWTLQELLAPAEVEFYGREWVEEVKEVEEESTATELKGEKEQHDARTSFLSTKSTLPDILSQITGINPDILQGERSVYTASVAQRMSWAAKRTTTRAEDAAYSLMGLFDVNMPMLYGEGEKAFLRLQEEIVKRSDDQSIFAWALPDRRPSEKSPDKDGECVGLLAPSPAAFVDCGFIFNYTSGEGAEQPPWSITNNGLSITLPLSTFKSGDGAVYLARLECHHGYFDGSPGIYLKALEGQSRQYARVRSWETVAVRDVGKMRSILVRQVPQTSSTFEPPVNHVIALTNLRLWSKSKKIFGMGSQEVSFHGWRMKEAIGHGNALEGGSKEKQPGWVDSTAPFLFRWTRPGRLAAVCLFQRAINREQFVLLVGSNAASKESAREEYKLHWLVLASDFGSCLRSFESYEPEYQMSSMPWFSPMDLGRLRLICDVASQKVPGSKRHVVSLDIYT